MSISERPEVICFLLHPSTIPVRWQPALPLQRFLQPEWGQRLTSSILFQNEVLTNNKCENFLWVMCCMSNAPECMRDHSPSPPLSFSPWSLAFLRLKTISSFLSCAERNGASGVLMKIELTLRFTQNHGMFISPVPDECKIKTTEQPRSILCIQVGWKELRNHFATSLVLIAPPYKSLYFQNCIFKMSIS